MLFRDKIDLCRMIYRIFLEADLTTIFSEMALSPCSEMSAEVRMPTARRCVHYLRPYSSTVCHSYLVASIASQSILSQPYVSEHCPQIVNSSVSAQRGT